jgi:hypothetical protein
MEISTAIDTSTVAFLQSGYANNRFVASANANWAGVAAGHWLSIVGSPNVPYDIAAVYPPGTAGNQTVDRWELTVVGVINESANAAAAYVVGIDFTANLGLWDPQLRDSQTLQFLKRNFRIIDNKVSTPNSGQGQTIVSAAGNTNSTQSKNIHYWRIRAQAGAGAYVATFSLPRSGRLANDVCKMHIDVDATANPTFQVFDNTTGGTKLFEWSGDGTATQIVVECLFDGAQWNLFDAHFLG